MISFRDAFTPASRPGVHRNPRLVKVIEEQGGHTGKAEGLSNGKAVMSVEDGAGDAVHQERQIHWPLASIGLATP